jgi:hypothetical protein
MMVSAHRFRSIGWIALLLVCLALVMVLAFRVNSLRSQVHRTEQQIIALRREKLYLETEVETRANQQQLKLWNDVEFGYVAPSASQYLSSERQLAAFAKSDGPDAPAPIRVASADDTVAAEAAFSSVFPGLGGDPDLSAPAAGHAEEEDARRSAKPADGAERVAAAANLGARLATVGALGKAAKDKPGKSGESKDGKKAGLAKAGKDDAARPGKGARLTPEKADAKPGSKPGKPAPAKSAPAAKPAKSTKPAKGGRPTP